MRDDGVEETFLLHIDDPANLDPLTRSLHGTFPSTGVTIPGNERLPSD